MRLCVATLLSESSVSLILIKFKVTGSIGVYPDCHGERGVGYTLITSLIYHRANIEKRITIHTRIHTYSHFRITVILHMSLRESWSTWKEPTQTRGEHANSTQEGPRLDLQCCLPLFLPA